MDIIDMKEKFFISGTKLSKFPLKQQAAVKNLNRSVIIRIEYSFQMVCLVLEYDSGKSSHGFSDSLSALYIIILYVYLRTAHNHG